MDQKIDSVVYETVKPLDGSLPLLTPMSKVAGRMSVLAAAHCLVSPQGEAGLLLGGVPGTPAAKVTIIGGAVVGAEAAKIAVGMRAIVRILDVNPKRPTYRNRRRRGVQYDSQWWDENRAPVTDRFSQWLLG